MTDERKLYDEWLRQSSDLIISAWDVWLGRAALSAQLEPAAHSEQWWLHRIEMEKTQAWQQGYAQGLHRASKSAAPTEPAPGWCKHCRQYTIEEPLQAAPTVVEPVAWMWRNTKTGARGVYFENPARFFDSVAIGDYEWTPLYATPPRAALTAQQLDALIQAHVGGSELQDGEYSAMVIFAAAVERAHGIGGPRNE